MGTGERTVVAFSPTSHKPQHGPGECGHPSPPGVSLASAACLVLSHFRFLFLNKLQGCDKSVGTIFPTAFALSVSGSHFDNSLISHFSFAVIICYGDQ